MEGARAKENGRARACRVGFRVKAAHRTPSPPVVTARPSPPPPPRNSERVFLYERSAREKKDE